MAGPHSSTRHSHVHEQLVTRLATLKSGDFFPTVAELMNEFNASQVTITQALQRLQNQGFIRRPVGKKRYVVTQQAQRREANITVLRPTWPSPEYDSLLSSLQHECTQRHWNLALTSYADWADVDLHRLMGAYDGIISIGHPADMGEQQESHIAAKGYPFVTLMDRPETGAFSGVLADDIALGRIAVETLRGLGHRRIAVMLNEPRAPSVSQRLQGWRAAMEAAGETDLDRLVIDCSVVRGEDSIELGRQRLDAWLGDRPLEFTALFATAWTGAVAAMRVLHEHHIDLPAQCSLISQGGLWPIGRYLAPALSTLDSNPDQWAKAACDLLAGQISGTATEKHLVTLAPEVHLRGTTAPAPAAVVPPAADSDHIDYRQREGFESQ